MAGCAAEDQYAGTVKLEVYLVSEGEDIVLKNGRFQVVKDVLLDDRERAEVKQD